MCTYYCCSKCKGLLTVKRVYLQHTQCCDGDPVNSPCTLFACAKTDYLQTLSVSSGQQINSTKHEDAATREDCEIVGAKRLRQRRIKGQGDAAKGAGGASLAIKTENIASGNDDSCSKQKCGPVERDRPSASRLPVNADNDEDVSLPVSTRQNRKKGKRKSKKSSNKTQAPSPKQIETKTESVSDIGPQGENSPSVGDQDSGGDNGTVNTDSTAASADHTNYSVDQLMQDLGVTIVLNRQDPENSPDAKVEHAEEFAVETKVELDEEEEIPDEQNESNEAEPPKKPKLTSKEYSNLRKDKVLMYQKYRVTVGGDLGTGTEKGGTPVYKYKCPHCKFETKFVGFFDRHLAKCHVTEGQWACGECSQVFYRKSKWKAHVNKHVKPFMCEVCSYRCADSRDLKQHVWKHTGELPFKCTYCDYRTRFRKALIEHQRKHSGDLLKCSEEGCDFSTFYKWSLVSHNAAKHQEEKRFMCPDCGYRTSDSGSFTKHLKLHEGLKQFKCRMCDYHGMTRHDTVRHMRRHTKEKVYFCDRCKFSTGYASGLKTHMMQHYGVKPWQCAVCGYNSILRSKVVRHLKQKHPEHSAANSITNLGLKLDINPKNFRQKHLKMEYSVEKVIYADNEVVVQDQVIQEVPMEQSLEITTSDLNSQAVGAMELQLENTQANLTQTNYANEQAVVLHGEHFMIGQDQVLIVKTGAQLQ